jgi:hypothetical protein
MSRTRRTYLKAQLHMSVRCTVTAVHRATHHTDSQRQIQVNTTGNSSNSKRKHRSTIQFSDACLCITPVRLQEVQSATRTDVLFLRLYHTHVIILSFTSVTKCGLPETDVYRTHRCWHFIYRNALKSVRVCEKLGLIWIQDLQRKCGFICADFHALRYHQLILWSPPVQNFIKI